MNLACARASWSCKVRTVYVGVVACCTHPPSHVRRPRGGLSVKVDLEQLKSLCTLLRDEEIAEFEHEADGVRIKVVRGGRAAEIVSAALGPATRRGDAEASSTEVVPTDTIDITSPFVGTFYRAASPENPAFVEVGASIKPGQTLCIIEAMKLMNEIEAEFSGTILEIFAPNGKPVEFGQKLFRVRKA
jgi:acetyl-CoA carboxylase biotin carboxyl carrier protein